MNDNDEFPNLQFLGDLMVNESLSMKVNELASLDKLVAIANLEGLSYNNDNIKRVTEDD